MRHLAILFLTCTVFAGVIWFTKPVAFADPGSNVLSAAKLQKFEISDQRVQLMHIDRAEHFVAVNGFGARRVISMFDMNSFSLAAKETTEKWRITNIDVVGNLMYMPRTYMTKRIVAGKELSEVPSRIMDEFETKNLEKLRKELAKPGFAKNPDAEFATWQEVDGGIRVLGSLRATKGCLECHTAKEGQLLGALSYTLRPATANDDPFDDLLPGLKGEQLRELVPELRKN